MHKPITPKSAGWTAGLLTKRKTALMAAVFGLGVLSLAAVNPGMLPAGSTAHAQAAAQATAPLSFADVVERVRPAVVSVRVTGRERRTDNRFFEGFPDGNPFEFFERRFGDRMPDSRRDRRRGERGHRGGPRRRGQGSGFFISEDGFVVTNNHVVDNAREVEIATTAGDTYKAKVIGTDPKTDLALLKVDADGKTFPTVEFSDSLPRVGDWVVAVGNPFGLGGTVTAGIVSARGRDIGSGPYDDYLQIDAAVNRGNSGGPTFDLSGKVVGVNTAIFSPSGGNVGIAFAISADVAQNVIADLQDDGKVTRGWLGVRIQPVTPDIADSIGLDKVSGALVTEPQEDSPAMKAGIRSGDAIIAVDGDNVRGPKDLARKIAKITPGKTVKVTVWRDGGEKEIDVALGTLAGSQTRAAAEPKKEIAPAAFERFGMDIAPLTDGDGAPGVVVTDVDPNGPAARNGIRRGDLIREVGGVAIMSPDDVETGVENARKLGRKSVLMRIEKDGESRFVAIPISRA